MPVRFRFAAARSARDPGSTLRSIFGTFLDPPGPQGPVILRENQKNRVSCAEQAVQFLARNLRAAAQDAFRSVRIMRSRFFASGGLRL